MIFQGENNSLFIIIITYIQSDIWYVGKWKLLEQLKLLIWEQLNYTVPSQKREKLSRPQDKGL